MRNGKSTCDRANTIEMNRREGYKARVLKRAFLTDFTEYIVALGDQSVRVQTPHRNMFRAGEECFLRVPSPIWYESGKDAADAERERRTLV